MKRIVIICEGQTEQSFCNDVLQPHFSKYDIGIQNPVIKKTRGGIVNWQALKHQIENHLTQDSTTFITTFIDFYGMHAHHDYPRWNEVRNMYDKEAAITNIEVAMALDISTQLQRRFIPYIQLYEFEALLFSDIGAFDNGFEEAEFIDYNYLVETLKTNPNPEMINDGVETAPSKRLAKIIQGYQKVVHGALLAHDIGLVKIRNKCPRFNHWIEKLEAI